MAVKQANSAHRGFYGGTHGNMATAVGSCTEATAANDEVIFGKLPTGLSIKKVGAGCNAAAAGVTVDLKMRTKDGTETVLAAGLDVNNKFTVKDIYPVQVGFDDVEVFAVVKGGARTAPLVVTVEYLTIGTM